MQKMNNQTILKQLYKTFCKMRIALLLTVFFMPQCMIANVYGQNSNINIEVKNRTLVEVFQEIRNTSKFTFVYDVDDVKSIKNVSVSKKNATITQVLNACLKNTGLAYKIIDKKVVVVRKEKISQKKEASPQQKEQQKFTIKGRVTDGAGEPLPGVSILVKGTKVGTTTDFDGNYTLQFTQKNAELVFSYLGMITQIVKYKGQTVLNIVLKNDLEQIDEVVVTGYQTIKANQSAGSYNQIGIKEFERKITSDLPSTLEGLSPSLVLTSNPDTGSKELTIRGVSTLQGTSEPLIILDGFPYEGELSDINPYEVENITLLKDAASASIYGAKSANGVIVITSKKGKKGEMEIRYAGNAQLFDKANIGYVMNRVSSSELVDIQKSYFETYKDRLHSYQYYIENNNAYAKYYVPARNKVVQLYLDHKEGRISQSELDNQISALRTIDNTKDLEKLMLQTPINTQHNLSISYGGEQYRLRSSLNYLNSKGNFKGVKNDRFIYNINSTIDFSDRFKLDLLANLNFGKEQSTVVDRSRFYKLSSYERLYDDFGNPKAVTMPYKYIGTNSNGIYGGKDAYEIKRLNNLGLLDETYYPASDYDRTKRRIENWKARFQAQLRVNLVTGLVGRFGFNYKKGNDIERKILPVESWDMRSLINNLTKKSETGQKGELLLPLGGRITEKRGDETSYLVRGQLNYEKKIGDSHELIAMLGSEIQSVKNTSTYSDRFGYDEASNTFREVDYATLREDISNVFHPNGSIAGGLSFSNEFEEIENRYFSLYANTNYTYLEKYILYGSVRIDQSNLFGTDPKYRFKPFWSVGSKWRIAEEDFFKDNIFSRLDLQVSYGLNGNISNDYGPYDIAEYISVYRAGGALGLNTSSYAVPDLRWETTTTFNVGLHSSLLNDRLSVSFDYYRKHSRDILANAEADPTLGTNYVVRNDATILNNGYEFIISTENIKTDDFKWNTHINLSYNKSKVEEIYEEDNPAYFIAGKVKNRLGHEPKSLFVFDWAGVDNEGNGLIRRSNGDLVAISPSKYEGGTFLPTDLSLDDLQYAGTTMPKYIMGLTNNLMYKNISLSFMFVYQGGHVLMRDSYNGSSVGGYVDLVNAEAGKAWTKSGDEKTTIVPRLNSATYYSVARASTKNIIDGDFIRLRDVVLSYTVPKEISKKAKMKEVTLNLKGTNLYLWTKNKWGIDTETQGLGTRRLPLQKSLSLGVNITF